MKILIAIAIVLSCGVVHAGCPGGVCSLRHKPITTEAYAVENYISAPAISVENSTNDVIIANNTEVQTTNCCSTPVQTSNCCSTCDNVVVKNNVKSRRCRCRNRCR